MKKIYFLAISSTLLSLAIYSVASYAEIRFPPRPGRVSGSPVEIWSRANKSEAEGKWRRAIDLYQELVDNYPDSQWAPDALYHLGICREEIDELYAAFQAYQMLLDEYPGKGKLEDILSRQFEIGEAFLKGRKRLFLFLPIRSGLASAAEIFSTIVQNATFSDFAPRAQYNRGLALQKQGKYDEAELEYDMVYKNYPNSEMLAPSIFQRGVCSYEQALRTDYDQKTTGQAIKWFEIFLKRFPDNKDRKKAEEYIVELRGREAEKIYRIGRYYEKKGSRKGARIYYREVLNDYPGTSWAELADKRLAKLKEEEGD